MNAQPRSPVADRNSRYASISVLHRPGNSTPFSAVVYLEGALDEEQVPIGIAPEAALDRLADGRGRGWGGPI